MHLIPLPVLAAGYFSMYCLKVKVFFLTLRLVKIEISSFRGIFFNLTPELIRTEKQRRLKSIARHQPYDQGEPYEKRTKQNNKSIFIKSLRATYANTEVISIPAPTMRNHTRNTVLSLILKNISNGELVQTGANQDDIYDSE